MTPKRTSSRNQSSVTIVDVAREAGVSTQTVSRVINNKDNVTAKTRQRVLDAIETLGFTPHTTAQRLRVGNANAIAVLYPLDFPDEDPVNQLQLEFAVGAAAAAGSENYFCNLLTNPITESMLLGLYRSAQIDGVILMEIHDEDWRVDRLREHDYPFVMIGRCADNTGLSFVELDLEAAIVKAFDHLAELGHTQIGLLTFSDYLRERGYGPAACVWQGYERATDKHGLDELYRGVHFSTQSMYAATFELLEEQPELTAIVSATDAPTGSVVNALLEVGRVVPDDISIVGLATDSIARIISPPLTAITFPAYDMGFQAATILIKKLKGEVVDDQQVMVEPELVIRGSTAPPR